ncbi:MAG TPA: GGDEF domain-containing protein [Terracidiphilus sp.]|nr:GGDEF domain-containing protein [Terracidiphilus sp.]
MRNPALPLSEPDPALLRKLALIEQGYLAVAALLALGALGGWLSPVLGQFLPGSWMLAPQAAVAVLLGAGSLELSRSRHPAWLRQIGFLLALALAVLSVAVLVRDWFGVSTGLDLFAAESPEIGAVGRMPALTAAAFAVLADAVMLIRARRGLASHMADLFSAVFCLLVLVMISMYMIEGFAGPAGKAGGSLLTLLSVSLLAFVAFMRRAEVGAFVTFLGAGSGSRIARLVAPLVLLVPFLPQTALVHAVKSGLVRTEYVSISAAFITAGLSFAVMLYMAWKINRLERRVRELSLNDELTGLYGRRGFHAVGWQALRQARRSGLPFSVMFIDVEGLTQVVRKHGGEIASQLLVETAELLKASFRATDVIGRVDPTHFAVAGHFSENAIATMRLRLQEAVNYRNSNPGRACALHFSIGCVSAKDPRHETLEDMLARADESRDQELQERDPLPQHAPKATL